ncbi:hypothetical protein [Domibacillus robiginosus]|uniref:hypothetical protein n=1 Tax=Domibacillus robiginosus TaxID=1071054 RepID=UPI00067DA8AB|nr:hypothetical protein [Domibacillus robiginosus]
MGQALSSFPPAAFVRRKNSKTCYYSPIKRNEAPIFIHSRFFSKKAGGGLSAKTTAGRADRLKQTAKSNGGSAFAPTVSAAASPQPIMMLI